MPGPPACGRGPTRYIHVDMYMYLHRAPSINKLCHPRWYVEQPREAILETYSRIDARDHDHGVTRTPSSAIHTQKVNLPNPTALSADSTPLWLFAIGIRFTSPPPHRSSNGALAHGAPNARRTSRRANEKRCSLMLHWPKGGGGGISAYLEPHVFLCTGCCHAALHRDTWRLTRALRP